MHKQNGPNRKRKTLHGGCYTVHESTSQTVSGVAVGCGAAVCVGSGVDGDSDGACVGSGAAVGCGAAVCGSGVAASTVASCATVRRVQPASSAKPVKPADCICESTTRE